jgi:hypothetical protein
MLTTAPLESLLVASPIHQDAPHRLGRRRVEVAPAVPLLGFVGVDQSEVRFMDQSRGLEGLARLLPSEPLGGQLAHLVVDQR